MTTTRRHTHRLTIEITLTDTTTVFEYVGNGRSRPVRLAAGTAVQVTYSDNATNAGVHTRTRKGTWRRDSFHVGPLALDAVVGFDLAARCRAESGSCDGSCL